MPTLKGTKTHENLKDAFAGESQANRRYLYFAKVADVEGYPEIAGNFRDTAEGETGHAHGHLDYLKQVGDPATDLPIGDTSAEPQGRRGGRDPRVHRHVPGHGQDRARRGLRRDRRLVRDPGQGREVPRRPLPEAARRASAEDRPRVSGLPASRRPDVRRPSPTSRPTGSPTTRRSRVTGTRRALHQEISAGLRDLPRLPHVLQVLRRVPDAVLDCSTSSTTATCAS